MNMRSITEWQREIAGAANRKFPGNDSLLESDRLASIQRQLDDVVAAIKVEQGYFSSDHHAHKDPDHRIAALIADVLILAEMRGADVEKELGEVLRWFMAP